jgi:hypothetical protein
MPAVPRAAALTLVATLAACSAIKTKDEASDIVSRRAVGMQAGAFFDAYGPARSKVEALDGGAVYRWQSSIGSVPPGPQSLDERICNLTLTVDKGGKVTAVEVARDTHGRASASRCGEIFR